MTAFPRLNGWIRHLFLTVSLHFASPLAVVYGYLVPVFFLVAFGSLYRSDSPPLQAHMGQILTITILGGACFGLPTALVSERERGIWRRYRLLPIPVAWLVMSAMVARVLIAGSAVLMQLALARAVYGTPLPAQPGIAVLAFFYVTAVFLALGLLIAALADTVPAVQALGQCIFLPMIIIGGVGMPLAALPGWAQRASGFMPGRYAVEILQPGFDGNGLPGAGFRFAALGVIGLSAGCAAIRLFRWEAGARISRPARLWVGAALAAWIAVGAFAWQTGRLRPVSAEPAAWANITEAQIAAIGFAGLPGDHDLAAPIATVTADRTFERGFASKLGRWSPGRLDDVGQSIRNLVGIAAVADLCADPREAEIARSVFGQIGSSFEPAQARQALAWIILDPEDGQTPTKAPELGLVRHPPERLVRQRSVLYAEKYLGRLLGKLSDR